MPKLDRTSDRLVPDMKRAGEWIRIVREKRGLSQEDLAHKAGMARNTLQKYEAGKATKIDELMAIQVALDLPTDHLFIGLRMAAESASGVLPAGALGEALRVAEAAVPYATSHGAGDAERLQAGMIRMIEASFPDANKRVDLLKHLLAVIAAYIP